MLLISGVTFVAWCNFAVLKIQSHGAQTVRNEIKQTAIAKTRTADPCRNGQTTDSLYAVLNGIDVCNICDLVACLGPGPRHIVLLREWLLDAMS